MFVLRLGDIKRCNHAHDKQPNGGFNEVRAWARSNACRWREFLKRKEDSDSAVKENTEKNIPTTKSKYIASRVPLASGLVIHLFHKPFRIEFGWVRV
jgi:hypothetical protein